ncbi:nuclear transport factor 2 family protein [Rhodococcus sp. X156]|uniref:nuclear transport factor 2 family protein n=1 Tax=Rhodococcus sp. X156 TaxID=2499145 RepID=UPI000FDA0717|nr:nuclear transport factor 2 family protein [Rhodococcus sp. X156]
MTAPDAAASRTVGHQPEEHPARVASRRSMDAVGRRAKDEWVALFAEDAVIEDPVGPSHFSPDGSGQRGKQAIADFWDASVGTAQKVAFTIADSFACGDEVANVGVITTTVDENVQVDAEGVFIYRVNAEGLIVSLRAFWETDRAMATLRRPS